jgi:hypothetical protein
MLTGIVGCGHICQQYLQALIELSNVEAVGVFERKITRAQPDAELRALLSWEEGPVSIDALLAAALVQKLLQVYGTAMSLNIDLATIALLRRRARWETTLTRALTDPDLSYQLIAGTPSNKIRAVMSRLPRSHYTLTGLLYASVGDGAPILTTGGDGFGTVFVLRDLGASVGA